MAALGGFRLSAKGDVLNPTHRLAPLRLPSNLDESLGHFLNWMEQTSELATQRALDLADAKERTMRLRALLANTPRPFHRSTLPGHVTGSALLLDASGRFVCLLHHAKLGLWLQPGGHSDGQEDTWAVALREATEETGLAGLRLESFCESRRVFPIDVDIHLFPPRGLEPEHLHFDVRFLIVSSGDAESTPLPGNNESHGIAWFPITALQTGALPNTDASVQRLFHLAAFLAKARR